MQAVPRSTTRSVNMTDVFFGNVGECQYSILVFIETVLNRFI